MTRNMSEDSFAKTLSGIGYRVRQLERRPCPMCGRTHPLQTYRRISNASTNAAVISACPAIFYGHQLGNTNLTLFRYVHLFDQSTSPVSMSNVKLTLSIPWQSGANQEYPDGVEFETGLAIAFSTSPSTLTAVAAEEVIANIAYIPDDCPPVETESSATASGPNSNTAIQTSLVTRRVSGVQSNLRRPI